MGRKGTDRLQDTFEMDGFEGTDKITVGSFIRMQERIKKIPELSEKVDSIEEKLDTLAERIIERIDSKFVTREAMDARLKPLDFLASNINKIVFIVITTIIAALLALVLRTPTV